MVLLFGVTLFRYLNRLKLRQNIAICIVIFSHWSASSKPLHSLDKFKNWGQHIFAQLLGHDFVSFLGSGLMSHKFNVKTFLFFNYCVLCTIAVT